MEEFLVGDRVKWALTDMVYKILFIKGSYIVIENELTGSITNVEPSSIRHVELFEKIDVIEAITKAYANEPVFYSQTEEGLRVPFSWLTSFEDIGLGVDDLYDLAHDIIFYIDTSKSTGGK